MVAGTDGAQLLANLSGLSRDDAKSIWEEVKANSARLKSCARHRFLAGSVKIGEKRTCVNCGGEMDLTRIGAYIRGYRDSGGNPDDVWPGFFDGKN